MKTAILLVGYGAANPESRKGIKRFGESCESRFPDLPVRWAYTSPLVRDRMARQRQKSDSVIKALMRLHYEKFEVVAIQPLQCIPGVEYQTVIQSAEQIMSETGIKCKTGKPLLNDLNDIDILAEILVKYLSSTCPKGEDAIFMAHGARHSSGYLYEILAKRVNFLNPFAHIAAMSSSPGLQEILPELKSARVWLLPLFSVIGVHALRDMAGCGNDSWKKQIEAQNHECVPVLRGLAEVPEIAGIWLDNLCKTLSGIC